MDTRIENRRVIDEEGRVVFPTGDGGNIRVELDGNSATNGLVFPWPSKKEAEGERPKDMSDYPSRF